MPCGTYDTLIFKKNIPGIIIYRLDNFFFFFFCILVDYIESILQSNKTTKCLINYFLYKNI